MNNCGYALRELAVTYARFAPPEPQFATGDIALLSTPAVGNKYLYNFNYEQTETLALLRK